MRTLSRHLFSTTMALAVPLALSPMMASAQEPPPEPEPTQCIATVEPEMIEAGQEAVEVTAILSEEIGPVDQFTGPEDSGLTLADPADIPRADMANPEEPIEMTPETNTVALWLTTARVTPGELEIRIHSEESYCTGQITVIATPGL